jgi:hypothetical protein
MVQVHLRLRPDDAALLKRLALERDQTISAVVTALLRLHCRRSGMIVSTPEEVQDSASRNHERRC